MSMIDFTGVTAITIPEGNVIKITKGSTILWQKPEPQPEQQDYIVVFPATEYTENELTYFGNSTSIDVFELRRMPQIGDKHVVYVNGTAYESIAFQDGDQINFCLADGIYAATQGAGMLESYISVAGVYDKVVLEVHYIPRYEIVFPATTYSGADLVHSTGRTYLPDGNLYREPQDGETYIVYINGDAHSYVAELRDGSVEFCVDDVVYAATWEVGSTGFYASVEGTLDSVTIEIHRARY